MNKEERDRLFLFDAPKYFFLSTRLAEYFPDLRESKLIMSYTSIWPKQSYKRTEDITSTYKFKKVTFLSKVLSTFLLYVVSGLLSFPLNIQDLVFQWVGTVAVGYVAYVHIQLYNMFPLLVIVPILIICSIAHFIYVVRKGATNKKKMTKIQIMDDSDHSDNNIDDSSNVQFKSRRRSVIEGINVVRQINLLNNGSGSGSEYTSDGDSNGSSSSLPSISNDDESEENSSEASEISNFEEDSDENTESDVISIKISSNSFESSDYDENDINEESTSEAPEISSFEEDSDENTKSDIISIKLSSNSYESSDYDENNIKSNKVTIKKSSDDYCNNNSQTSKISDSYNSEDLGLKSDSNNKSSDSNGLNINGESGSSEEDDYYKKSGSSNVNNVNNSNFVNSNNNYNNTQYIGGVN
jgi:hypothetical protein